MSSTGCTPRLIQKLIEFSIRGCFRRIRSRLRGSFSPNPAEKHGVRDAVFLVDDADDLIGGLRQEGLSYRVQLHGFRNQVERVFREVQRRTSSFSNCFSHVDPATAETWLQAHAVWWNHV